MTSARHVLRPEDECAAASVAVADTAVTSVRPLRRPSRSAAVEAARREGRAAARAAGGRPTRRGGWSRAWQISSLTRSVVPEPMVIMAITAATPMTMPSKRQERSAAGCAAPSAGRASPSQATWTGSVFDAVIGDVAVEEADGALGMGGDVRLMSDHHHGQIVFAVQTHQESHDLVAALGVEIAGRFVGDKQSGAGDDGAGDGHGAACWPPDSSAGVWCSRPMKADLGERFHGQVRVAWRAGTPR